MNFAQLNETPMWLNKSSTLNELQKNIFDQSIASIGNMDELYDLEYPYPWLPSTIKSIKWIDKFNESEYYLPPNLEKLQFGSGFNQQVDNLPSGLKELIFGSSFNRTVDNLPLGLKKIVFGNNFNQSVDNLPSIEIIVFGDNFNKLVDNLPNQLRELTFGSDFNQIVDNLPLGLKKIIFGCIFNQVVDNLPSSIEEIIFGKYFMQSVINLPNNIKKLKFEKKQKKISTNWIPVHRQVQAFGAQVFGANQEDIELTDENIENLCSNVEILEIHPIDLNKMKKLPQNVSCLIIYDTSSDVETILSKLKGKIPLGLKILECHGTVKYITVKKNYQEILQTIYDKENITGIETLYGKKLDPYRINYE
jgi:hypothetical protein